MRYFYPFMYAIDGEGRGFLTLGMHIRNDYLKWIDTEDEKHLYRAIPCIALLVGWQWKKLFGSKQFDLDVMDPVTYKVITKFHDTRLPTEFSLAEWLRTLVRRNLIHQAYKRFIPEFGDKSVRKFNYRPFPVPADSDHSMFVDEMKDIVLDHVEHNTRLEFEERKACRYIAELMLQERLPSPLVLRDKYSIPYPRQEFYLHFTRVIVRRELYKVRTSLPFLYGKEENPFVMVADVQTHEPVVVSDVQAYEVKEEQPQEEAPRRLTTIWDI